LPRLDRKGGCPETWGKLLERLFARNPNAGTNAFPTSPLPRTPNDHVAAAWIAAVIDVVIGVIVDAAIHAGAVACWQNGNDPLRGRTHYCLVDNDRSGTVRRS
jgi:hypothetical protein